MDYCALRSCVGLALITTPSGLGSHSQRAGIPAKMKLGWCATWVDTRGGSGIEAGFG